MNVWIVESENKNAKMLAKVLKHIEPTITNPIIFSELVDVYKKLQVTKPPKLILANQNSGIKTEPSDLENARIIFPLKNQTLVYLAFCVERLKDHSLTLQPLTAESPLTDRDEFGITKPGGESDRVIKPYKSRFLVMHGQKFMSISIENIAYFFSDDRFVFFMTFDKQKFLVEYRMEELQQLLDPQVFFRINRSYIVSINALESIHPYFGSRFKLKLNPATTKEIIVSRERTSRFRHWLGGQ